MQVPLYWLCIALYWLCIAELLCYLFYHGTPSQHFRLSHTAVLSCRFDVYICTTAEKEYALEAWRLLDPEGTIFPTDQLVSRRMLCVPHPAKKDLLNVLRWEQVYAQMLQDPKKPPSILVTDESECCCHWSCFVCIISCLLICSQHERFSAASRSVAVEHKPNQQAAAAALAGRLLKGGDAPSATMAVIVDDRADVWEEASRKDLMQV